MNNRTTHPGFAIVAAAGLASITHAGVANGDRFQMNQRGEVVAEFLHSDAGAKGSLYFVGHAGVGESITYATSSDANGLGAFLFSNKSTPAGTSVRLGEFDPLDTLYFAYLITQGSGAAVTGSLARNDSNAGFLYFHTHSTTPTPDGSRSVIGVEDIFAPVSSDWDYNDMTFALNVTAVPTPGAGLLAAMGAAVACRRKRRAPPSCSREETGEGI